MKNTVLAALLLSCLLLPATAQRADAVASWDEGKISINYGAPSWRDDFAESMKNAKVWRLGNNDPTSMELSCGLQTNDGTVPAGTYKIAMQRNAGGKWDLVVYTGNGHFQKGRKCWRIQAASSKEDAKPSGKLSLKFEKQTLLVQFGPHEVIYPVNPIRMHKPVETRFANYPVKIQVMAIPMGNTIKNTRVGTASIDVKTRNGATTVDYAMHLSMDGQGASLKFVNARAAAMGSEKAQLESTIKRVRGMLDGASKKRAEGIKEFLAKQEKELQGIATAEQIFQRFHTSRTVTGTLSDRHNHASTLDFTHERPEGAIVLTFGANDKAATFDINPKEFRAPRQRR